MKKTLVFAAALITAGTIVAPAANARLVFRYATVQTARFASAHATTGADTATGGCFFAAAISDVRFATGVVYQGVLGDASVTQDGAGNPIGATVTCQVRVNGNFDPATQKVFSGPSGVQAGVAQLMYTALPGDFVSLCEDVHFADGTDTGLVCQAATEIKNPPQGITDTLDTVFDLVVDPIVCPVLRSLAGTYPLVVRTLVIELDGDVYINGGDQTFIYDCPPYAV
jgi:hypothetical protein